MKKIRKRIGAELRAMWNTGDAVRAQAALNDLIDSYRDRRPTFAEWIESGIPEGFAVFALPDRHRISRKTSNTMEKAIQQELKRKTKIFKGFPKEQSLLRLCTTVVVQIDEMWGSGKAYIRWETDDD